MSTSLRVYHPAAASDRNTVPMGRVLKQFIDAIGGQIHLLFASGLSAIPHVHTGKLKLIAVTTLKRLHQFPEVPTVHET